MSKDPKDVASHFMQATGIILEVGSRTSFINPVGQLGEIAKVLPKALERCYGEGKSRHANPGDVTQKSGSGALKPVSIESLNLLIHFGETGNAPDVKQTKELAGFLSKYFYDNKVRVTAILEDAINGRADIEVKLALLEDGLNAENRDEHPEAIANQHTLTVAQNLAMALVEEIRLVAQARAKAEAETKLKGNVPALTIS